MRQLGHSLMLCFALALLSNRAPAQDWDHSGQPTSGDRHWSEVVEIAAQAERADNVSGAGSYEGSSAMHFSPQGRFALLPEPVDGETDPRYALVGRYRRKGNWLELHFEGKALDHEDMKADQREAYLAWLARAAPRREVSYADLNDDKPSRRLLIVPWHDGELLIDQGAVKHSASSWDGVDALHLYPTAWSVPGLAPPEESHRPDVQIADPLNAALPYELKSLLRPEAIETRVVEVLEPAATLKWEHHNARLTLRLDRGERHGLYSDIHLYGVPPNDDISLRIKEVHADHVIAERWLERFSPSDPVDFPSVGQRFSMRRIDPVACVIDTSAALRATILSAKVPISGLQWDKEGYAWYEVQIDQGSAQGLALEDIVRPENKRLDGEGRVRALQSDQATVLWRVNRNRFKDEIRVPQSGDVLVTQAWQRAETEVFGQENAELVSDDP